jgi:hypothetical protein
MTRQILLDGNSKKINALDVERYTQDGSLVIVDSLKSYFSQDHANENKIDTDNNKNKNNNNDNKLNILSLIRILLNHGMKNSKSGITIFTDMGSFFSGIPYNYNNSFEDSRLSNIFEYERSIPSSYKNLELKQFCLHHQKDYESHFASKRQKAQLLDCHNRSILVMDTNNNNNNNNHNSSNNKYKNK